MPNKFEMYGKVVFMWGKLEPCSTITGKPSYCCCCGDPKVPHRHNSNRHIEFESKPSKFFKPLMVNGMISFESEALHTIPNIEGKRVRITIEVVEEA